MNEKIRAFVQKYGTHGASALFLKLAENEGPTTKAYIDEVSRELSEALEEVLHQDPSSGH